jgi:hypothetical protein
MTNIPNQSGSMQQFANPLASGGFFGLERVGNSINTITAIPEPSDLRRRDRPPRPAALAPPPKVFLLIATMEKNRGRSSRKFPYFSSLAFL